MKDKNTPQKQDKDSAEQNEWRKRECGALWAKQGSSQKFFSGHISFQDEMGVEKKLSIVVFTNRHKQKDAHPDFRIYKSEPQQENGSEKKSVFHAAAERVKTETEEELL